MKKLSSIKKPSYSNHSSNTNNASNLNQLNLYSNSKSKQNSEYFNYEEPNYVVMKKHQAVDPFNTNNKENMMNYNHEVNSDYKGNDVNNINDIDLVNYIMSNKANYEKYLDNNYYNDKETVRINFKIIFLII